MPSAKIESRPGSRLLVSMPGFSLTISAKASSQNKGSPTLTSASTAPPTVTKPMIRNTINLAPPQYAIVGNLCHIDLQY